MEDAKKVVVARVKEKEEAENEYTYDAASEFVKSLLPLVEKVDKTVTKGGMALPKFEKFCKEHNLNCEWDSFVKDRKKYYLFRTWEIGESSGFDEDD